AMAPGIGIVSASADHRYLNPAVFGPTTAGMAQGGLQGQISLGRQAVGTVICTPVHGIYHFHGIQTGAQTGDLISSHSVGPSESVAAAASIHIQADDAVGVLRTIRSRDGRRDDQAVLLYDHRIGAGTAQGVFYPNKIFSAVSHHKG